MSAAVFRVHEARLALRVEFVPAPTAEESRYEVSLLPGRAGVVSVPFRHDLNGDERRADAVREWADRFGVGTRSTWAIVAIDAFEWVAVCVPGCDVVARVGGAK